MVETHHIETVDVVDRPISISHLVHKLHAYAPAIVLSTAAIAVLYIVLSITIYAFSPTQRITSQQFRLEFEGASEGKYPNGMKFSSSDLTSTPILLGVFHDDHLDRFTTFSEFSRSIFVLEANLEYERLAADYQARIADPKLSPVDRDRLTREWQAKAAALAKNDFSLNWVRTRNTAAVPESLVQKVLVDTLTAWAKFAVNEQHVLKYRLTVLSPEMMGTGEGENEPVVAIQVLRSKIHQVLANIEALRALPGSELARTRDGMSLADIQLRLDEIIRFRLEPLTGRVSATGLIANRINTLRFLESQLAYDQRYLKTTQDKADIIRRAFGVYSVDQRGFTPEAAAPASPGTRDQARTQRSDTLMPQISDSFLDRLLTLTSQASDIQYRQKLADEYRQASLDIIPAQEAVAYDQEVVALVKSPTVAAASGDAADATAKIVATRNEVKELLGRVNSIYDAVSANLSPAKELYTATAPPITRTEHTRSLMQLALYGVALVALSIPIIVILCLIHARIREEEATDAHVPELETA
jgi:hypothetical protein